MAFENVTGHYGTRYTMDELKNMAGCCYVMEYRHMDTDTVACFKVGMTAPDTSKKHNDGVVNRLRNITTPKKVEALQMGDDIAAFLIAIYPCINDNWGETKEKILHSLIEAQGGKRVETIVGRDSHFAKKDDYFTGIAFGDVRIPAWADAVLQSYDVLL